MRLESLPKPCRDTARRMVSSYDMAGLLLRHADAVASVALGVLAITAFVGLILFWH